MNQSVVSLLWRTLSSLSECLFPPDGSSSHWDTQEHRYLQISPCLIVSKHSSLVKTLKAGGSLNNHFLHVLSFNTNVLYSCKTDDFKWNPCGSKSCLEGLWEDKLCVIRTQILLDIQHFRAKECLCKPSEVTDRGYLLLNILILEQRLARWNWNRRVYRDK